ncbi:hypothetical protein Hanom_Chr11g01014781 [Helianthus anomalus]
MHMCHRLVIFEHLAFGFSTLLVLDFGIHVLETYVRYVIEKYGEDVTQHPVGDADLWEHAQGGSRFGIGSLDLSFVITDTASSSPGSASYADYQRSKEEGRNLQSQVERLNKRFEEAQQSHVELLQNRVEEMQQQMREDMQ